MNNNQKNINKISKAGLEQLGCFCKDINLYNLINKTQFGKSDVGKEMDLAGRWMFNHRFGGGHLWWKEFKNRPVEEWSDIFEHLASDFFTKAGLPYAIDGSIIQEKKELLKFFSASKSSDNWLMLNGFEFIAGSSSLIFACFDAKKLNKGYTSDLAFASDNLFIALNIAGGIVTSNPLLIISALIKSTTVIRKYFKPLGIASSSPFDVDIDDFHGLRVNYDVKIDELLNLCTNIDFYFNDTRFEYNCETK